MSAMEELPPGEEVRPITQLPKRGRFGDYKQLAYARVGTATLLAVIQHRLDGKGRESTEGRTLYFSDEELDALIEWRLAQRKAQ